MPSDSLPVICSKVSIIVAFVNLMESILTDMTCAFDTPGQLNPKPIFLCFRRAKLNVDYYYETRHTMICCTKETSYRTPCLALTSISTQLPLVLQGFQRPNKVPTICVLSPSPRMHH